MFFPFSTWQNTSPIINSSGLIAFYKLNADINGPSFKDSLGNYNLTPVYTPQITGGHIPFKTRGSSAIGIDFAFLSTGHNFACYTGAMNNDFLVLNNKTFAFWVNLQQIPVPQGGTTYTPVFFGNASSTAGNYSIYAGSSSNTGFQAQLKTGTISLEVYPTGQIARITSSGFSANNWNFIVAWIDYYNTGIGIQVNNGTTISGFFGHNIQNVGITGIFGSTFNVGSNLITNSISGIFGIQSLSIWNRLLTDSEKSLLYNKGFGVQYPFTNPFPQ